MVNDRPKITWDGTLNIPTIILAAGVILGGVSFANAMSASVTQLVNQVAETRADLKDMKSEIGDIKTKVATLEERTRGDKP